MGCSAEPAPAPSEPNEPDPTLPTPWQREPLAKPDACAIAAPGAEVAFDRETGQFAPPGPAWLGATDLGGLIRLLREFNANTVSGTDGKVRGRVVFHLADAPLSFSDLLLVKAPGYRAITLSLDAQFPQGLDYEDLSPQTIRVRLSPTPVPDHP